MRRLNRRSRGFTLAELLIVVAIIAVLTAIAIPVFNSQLEKSREATDTANIRGNYAEVMAEAVETGNDVNTSGALKVQLKMKNPDQWDGSEMQANLYSLASKGTDGKPNISGKPQVGGYAYVSYSQDNGVVIHFSGGSADNETPTGGNTPTGGGTQTDEETPTVDDPTQTTPFTIPSNWTTFNDNPFNTKIKDKQIHAYLSPSDTENFNGTVRFSIVAHRGNNGEEIGKTFVEFDPKDEVVIDFPFTSDGNYQIRMDNASGADKATIENLLMGHLYSSKTS